MRFYAISLLLVFTRLKRVCGLIGVPWGWPLYCNNAEIGTIKKSQKIVNQVLVTSMRHGKGAATVKTQSRGPIYRP